MTTSERFAREYQEYNGLTEGRRVEQQKIIAALAAHAGMAPEDCGADEVRSYLATLIEADQHPNTVRKKLNMLKPFFRWAWSAGLVDADTFLRIKDIKPPAKSSARGLPRPYKRPELDQFYRELEAAYPAIGERETYFWKRFAKGTSRFNAVRKDAMRAQVDAIVALALTCGLRRNEIFTCSLDDIHPDNEYVAVRHGKGGKQREVPHTDASRAACQRWIEVRHRLKVRHRSPWLSLWGRKKKMWGAPMTEDRFNRFFHKLGSGWELHRFRHTCGTEWLRVHRRIELVRDLLGHTSIAQTEGYAQIVRDDLAREMTKSQREFEERVGNSARASAVAA